MADRTDLLKRIRKCLALAAGADEHEAAAALGKARALMDAYGIDEADVALAEVGEATAIGSAAQRPANWELALVCSVTRAIPTHAILANDGVRFVGLSPAPDIAAYAFTFLFRQIKRARADYIRERLKRCKLGRKRARADVFCEGWASAVYAAVKRLHDPTPLDPLVRQYLAKRYADLASVKGRAAGIGGQVAADDRARGRDEGRKVDIQRGVGQRDEQRLLGA